MRYAFTALFVLVGMGLVVAGIHRSAAPRAAVPAQAQLLEGASAGGVFSGTLTYQTDNVGRSVPYLMFRSMDGSVTVKALTFTAASACVPSAGGSYPCVLVADAIPHYFGSGPVLVDGTVDAEHITVSDMRSLAGDTAGVYSGEAADSG